MNRRTLLTTSGSVLFAGCSGVLRSDSANEYSTELIEDATIADFESALKENGIDVDSTMEIAGNLSVMYYRDSSAHEKQVETIALTFVPYRGLVNQMLSFTSLKNKDARHGVGHVVRAWAESYAAGELSREEYLSNCKQTYGETA